ncbi:hypothetical protein Tco_0746670 [Tanacetum coccineum]
MQKHFTRGIPIALKYDPLQFESSLTPDLLKPLDSYSRSFSSRREVKRNLRNYTKNDRLKHSRNNASEKHELIDKYNRKSKLSKMPECVDERVARLLFDSDTWRKTKRSQFEGQLKEKSKVISDLKRKAKKSAQLQKDKEVNGKPSMIDPARLPNTANGCKPKPRNWQASMSSRVSNKDVHLGEHRKQKPFLKFNDLQCPTCKKCLYSANHDECVLEYLSRLNPRASAQNKDAKSHKTTKRYMPVEKSSASKKPERQIPTVIVLKQKDYHCP